MEQSGPLTLNCKRNKGNIIEHNICDCDLCCSSPKLIAQWRLCFFLRNINLNWKVTQWKFVAKYFQTRPDFSVTKNYEVVPLGCHSNKSLAWLSLNNFCSGPLTHHFHFGSVVSEEMSLEKSWTGNGHNKILKAHTDQGSSLLKILNNWSTIKVYTQKRKQRGKLDVLLLPWRNYKYFHRRNNPNYATLISSFIF